MNMCTYCSYNDRSLVSDAMQLNKISAHMHFATKNIYFFCVLSRFHFFTETNALYAFFKESFVMRIKIITNLYDNFARDETYIKVAQNMIYREIRITSFLDI